MYLWRVMSASSLFCMFVLPQPVFRLLYVGVYNICQGLDHFWPVSSMDNNPKKTYFKGKFPYWVYIIMSFWYIQRSANCQYWSNIRVLAMLALQLNVFSHTAAEWLVHLQLQGRIRKLLDLPNVGKLTEWSLCFYLVSLSFYKWPACSNAFLSSLWLNMKWFYGQID